MNFAPNLAAVLSGANGGDIMKTITTAIGAIVAIFTVVKYVIFIVGQNEWGILLTRGKISSNPRRRVLLPPGLHLLIPFLQTLEKVDTRDFSLDLPIITIERTDGQFEVKISLIWRVMTTGDMPVRARFRTSNLPETIQNLGTRVARDILKASDLAPDGFAQVSSDDFDGLMKQHCREVFEVYGVELVSALLNETARSMGQMIKESGSSRGAIIPDVLN